MELLKPRQFATALTGNLITTLFGLSIFFYFFKDLKITKTEWVIFSLFILFLIAIEYRILFSGEGVRIKKRFLSYVKAYLPVALALVLIYMFLPIPHYYRVRTVATISGIGLIDISIKYLRTQVGVHAKLAGEKIKSVLIAGIGAMAKKAENQIFFDRRSGYDIKGFINCGMNEECAVGESKVLGDINSLNKYLDSNLVDEIVIALPTSCTTEIQQVLSVADYHGIRAKCVLDYHEMFGTQYKITRFGQLDAVNIRQLPIDQKTASLEKDLFDRVFSATALILLSPLFLFIALLIKLESRGPVFYCPIRIGKGGKPFKVYKFRSMRSNDDAAKGTMSTVENDPRITRIGRFIRKYSIDELPQFINVLMGDMSVVGPRPHRRFLDRQLQESVYKYMIRHYVKPGITGWAQVNGWRGPSETDEQKLQRTKHDLWYIENWSFALDIRIIFLTLFSKMAHRSAF